MAGGGRCWKLTGPDKWSHNAPGKPRQVDIVETPLSGDINSICGRTAERDPGPLGLTTRSGIGLSLPSGSSRRGDNGVAEAAEASDGVDCVHRFV